MSDIESGRIIELIERQGTIQQVSNYLRSLNLPHSAGSWDDVKNKRLIPALKDGSLSQFKLITLLSQVEEFGHQHIFLFKKTNNSDVSSLFSDTSLEKVLSRTNPKLVINMPSFEDMPTTPRLVEVRKGFTGGQQTTTFKTVERRVESLNPVHTQEDGHLVVRYEQAEYRAVNTARFWEDGLAELRIFSQSDAISYSGLLAAFWSTLAPFVSEHSYSPLHLTPVKKALWDKEKRAEVMRMFSLKTSNHKNHTGNRIQAAAGPVKASMLDDATLVASIDEFNTEESGSYVDRASFAIRASGSNGVLARDINLILHGELNELIITSRITEQEYGHILQSILSMAGSEADHG